MQNKNKFIPEAKNKVIFMGYDNGSPVYFIFSRKEKNLRSSVNNPQ